jgi:hypothetical protein
VALVGRRIRPRSSQAKRDLAYRDAGFYGSRAASDDRRPLLGASETKREAIEPRNGTNGEQETRNGPPVRARGPRTKRERLARPKSMSSPLDRCPPASQPFLFIEDLEPGQTGAVEPIGSIGVATPNATISTSQVELRDARSPSRPESGRAWDEEGQAGPAVPLMAGSVCASRTTLGLREPEDIGQFVGAPA